MKQINKFQPDKKIVKFKKDVFNRASKVAPFIYQIGESELLRKPSRVIKKSEITTEEFKKKVKYLKQCLLKYRRLTGYGRGITAIQVGISERFSVIYKTPPTNNSKWEVGTFDDLLIIINPKIVRASREMSIYSEGCMSASPIIAPTKRPNWIEFEYLDEQGNKRYWDTKDDTDYGRMMNRVFQHEIDHMNGIINIDLCESRELFLESDPEFYKKASFKKVN